MFSLGYSNPNLLVFPIMTREFSGTVTFSALGIKLHFYFSEHLHNPVYTLRSIIRQSMVLASKRLTTNNLWFSMIFLANSQVQLLTPISPSWCHLLSFLLRVTPSDTHLSPFLLSEKLKCRTLAPLQDFSPCLEGCSRLPPGILGNKQEMPP